jgi:glycosyltransferase involved in cell wall biosynthesis
VLANSRPDINGYAIRTHDILRAQIEGDICDAVGLTSPYYADRSTLVERAEIDGVVYHRTLHPARDPTATGPLTRWQRKRAITRFNLDSEDRVEETQSIEQHTDVLDTIRDTEQVEERSETVEEQPETEDEMMLKGEFIVRRIIRFTRKLIRIAWQTTKRVLRFIRKAIRHVYRILKRSIRRLYRGSLRICRTIFKKFKRNIRRLTRPLRRMARPFPMWVDEYILMRKLTARIIEVAKEVSPDLIHAHTPYRVGIPALRASRRLRIPLVYEMRGVWEDTAVANGRWKEGNIAYSRFRRLETKVLRAADSVVCISQALKDEAISRGVDTNRITLVPNAVNRSEIDQVESRAELSAADAEELESTVASLALNDSTTVVGYIGSLREMEGVDLTADAVAILAGRGHDVRFLIVSGPANKDVLRDHCDELELGETAVLAGPVPHHCVPEYYRLIDAFVVSRPDFRVTRLVTPLKPYEAMLMSRPTILADLPALREIVTEGETGYLHPVGDATGLADVIEGIIRDREGSSIVGASAREWVLEERTWDTIVQRYTEVYSRALAVHEAG